MLILVTCRGYEIICPILAGGLAKAPGKTGIGRERTER